jgi:dihydrofolate reductase
MRRVRYRVAASLDGYIAGHAGEIDWIVADPTVDFGAIYAEFDTVLLGRRTYELTLQPGAPPWPEGWRIYVISRTLPMEQPAGVTVVRGRLDETVAALRAEPGRDIWLFGGGVLAASLLDAGLLDSVEVAVMPILLGGGTPLVAGASRTRLKLAGSRASPSGILNLRYDVQDAEQPVLRREN